MAMALEGVKIVECGQNLAGPMASRLLADWGADVVKIEHPRGDPVRFRFFRRYAGLETGSDYNYAWENINRNKRGITLNLAKENGRKILLEMVKQADVFLTNYRSGDLVKFHLEYGDVKAVNPKIIYAELTGYGSKGPDQNSPGFALSAFWTRAGVAESLRLPGQVPPITSVAFGDVVTSLSFAMGIAVALFNRQKTGIGQKVEASLYNTGAFVMSYDLSGTLLTGHDPEPNDEVKSLMAKAGNPRPDTRQAQLNPLFNFYETKDERWFCLAMAQPEEYWPYLCRAVEREDLVNDTRFNTFQGKLINHAQLFQILDDIFKTRTLSEWKERLDAACLPWAISQKFSEIINDPQARVNGFFDTFQHPAHGRVEMVANPIKLSETPAQLRMAAPELGQHTEEVLLEHGFNWDDIVKFKDEGTIG